MPVKIDTGNFSSYNIPCKNEAEKFGKQVARLTYFPYFAIQIDSQPVIKALAKNFLQRFDIIRLGEKNENFLFHLIGHAFFLVMFCWALIYFKERMLPFDNAFYCFKIIHFNEYDVENGRFGAILSQIIPLWALRKGCSLETFMKLYSVSFVLLNYIYFNLILYVIRNKWAAIALLFALCLAYRYTFFYTASEVHMAVAPCLFFWALISSQYLSWKTSKKLILFLVAALSVWYISTVHVLFFLVVLFVMVYEWIRIPEKRKDVVLITLFVTSIVYYGILILAIPKDSYQGNKMPDMETVITYLPQFFQLPSTKFFVGFSVKYYKELIFIFLSLIGLYIYRRRWLKFSFFMLSLTGFIILIMLTHYNGESPIVQENYFVLLGIFIGIPFTVEILCKLPRTFSLILIVLLLGSSMRQIYKTRLFYQQRNQYLERITTYGRTLPERKFIVNGQNVDWELIWIKWDIPFESLLLSSLKGPDSAATFYITYNMSEYDSILSDKSKMVGADFAPFWFGASDLNSTYFRLPQTTYRKLNTDQDGKFSASTLTNDSIVISFPQAEVTVGNYDFVTIPITLTNRTNRTIPSHITTDRPTYLSYHVFDKKGNEIHREGRRNPFEVDLLPGKSYTQGLRIDWSHFRKKGEYIVEVDLLTENVRWWEAKKRVKMIVK